MEVVCVGSGYVGSVTGTALAVLGHRVTIIDTDSRKVKAINAGASPIYEPGLAALISRMVNAGRLSASQTFDAVHEADVVFIAVGTPAGEDGTADLTYIRAAARSVGEHLDAAKFTVIAGKSTVPAGTADLVASIIEEASGLENNRHFAVVSNPEFLREGYALEDVFFPDRIVVGAASHRAKKVMKSLYAPLLERSFEAELKGLDAVADRAGAPVPVYFETDTKSAELIKYVSNAFLAVKISYINEVARLCDTLGANVLDVAHGMGLDSRIGHKFLQASSGWSGSCFPKDTAEIVAAGRKLGSEMSIIRAAIDANTAMHDYCMDKIRKHVGSLEGKNIGILGLTFKPNTDDARHTQAAYMIGKLADQGANVAVHDPQGMKMFREMNAHLPVRYCGRPEETALDADALVLLTHWDAYMALDWQQIYGTMKGTRYILDTRNFWRSLKLEGRGFAYEGLGTSTDRRGESVWEE